MPPELRAARTKPPASGRWKSPRRGRPPGPTPLPRRSPAAPPRLRALLIGTRGDARRVDPPVRRTCDRSGRRCPDRRRLADAAHGPIETSCEGGARRSPSCCRTRTRTRRSDQEPGTAGVFRALRVPPWHRLRTPQPPSSPSTTRSAPARRAMLQQHHQARHGSGHARHVESVNQNAIEPWAGALPLAAGRAEAGGAQVQGIERPPGRISPRRSAPSSSTATATYEIADSSAGWKRDTRSIRVPQPLCGYLTCPDCCGARGRRRATSVGRPDDRRRLRTDRQGRRSSSRLELSPKDATVAGSAARDPAPARSRRCRLDYLTLDRLSSLSGGESRRISQASARPRSSAPSCSRAVGVACTRDNQRLIDILRQLRDQNNTCWWSSTTEHDPSHVHRGHRSWRRRTGRPRRLFGVVRRLMRRRAR